MRRRNPNTRSHLSSSRRLRAVAGLAAAGSGLMLAASSSECTPWRGEPPEVQKAALMPQPSSVDEWIRRDLFGPARLAKAEPFTTPLIAHRFRSWTYSKMDPDSLRLGSVRAGRVLWAREKGSQRGCKEGWYELAQGGYACAGGSFRLADSPDVERLELSPRLHAALPYDYLEVKTDAAPRYERIPSPDEEARVLSGTGRNSAAVEVRMVGDYYLAVLGEEVDRGRRFYRTLRGKYVRAEDVVAPPVSSMHGERRPKLPLAFVIDDAVPLLEIGAGQGKGEPKNIGRAPRYARFPVERVTELGGAQYAVAADGSAVSVESIRVARQQERPSEVGAGEKWIHVALAEQTLVAYEGDTPVFATLVSTGKPGHDTPTGLYRIRDKHISTTMRGNDPVDGRYEVEAVPWTMYYYRGYALHGAYWHDQFGRVRSHGCTNLPPADARWLVHWTAPELPTGWHSVRARTSEGGTQVYITQ